jgi:hypothetical protein
MSPTEELLLYNVNKLIDVLIAQQLWRMRCVLIWCQMLPSCHDISDEQFNIKPTFTRCVWQPTLRYTNTQSVY